MTDTLDELTAPHDHEQDLLTHNATPLMRAVAYAMRLTPEIWQAAGQVGTIRERLPDEAVPFLIDEMGLDILLPYIVGDLRRVLEQGELWEDIRGTDDAICLALGWLGETPEIKAMPRDAWFDLFQLRFDAPVHGRERLERIIGLTRLSKEAAADVIRLYNDDGDDGSFDLNADVSEINGPGLVNDWSGFWARPDWPVLAFHDIAGGQAAIDIRFESAENQAPAGHGYGARDVLGVYSELFDGFTVNRDDVNGLEDLEPHWAEAAGARDVFGSHTPRLWKGAVGRTPHDDTPHGFGCVTVGHGAVAYEGAEFSQLKLRASAHAPHTDKPHGGHGLIGMG